MKPIQDNVVYNNKPVVSILNEATASAKTILGGGMTLNYRKPTKEQLKVWVDEFGAVDWNTNLLGNVTKDKALTILKNFHPVSKPKHYNLNPYGIECIDAIKAATCDAKGEEAAFQANIIKYVWRYRRKNGLEDLKKAKWYLDELIKLYEHGRYKDS